MTITAPTPITAAPAVPDSTSPEADFDTAFEAFLDWQKDDLQPGANALATNVYNNATEAASAGSTATAAALTATNAAASAVGAANFKGEWSTLTGALARPACVKHSGRFWLLLSDLADVTADTPGVSASWTVLDAGTVPSQTMSTASATVNAVVGVRYIFAANDIVLNAPSSANKGDYHGIRAVIGVTGCTWVWSSIKVRGGTPGTLDVDIQSMDLFYEDVTRGYI